MGNQYFQAAISEQIWDSKYRYRSGQTCIDDTIEDTWRRIAGALAGIETTQQQGWEDKFYSALRGFCFLPGGRIQAGAGTAHRVTLFNCFVMGIVEDSLASIFDALKEGALTMQQGGGVGYDFSSLRPYGMPAFGTGSVASGPISFMRIWDSMCATLLSTGARRGAMMATLRCDHPDIVEFITAKHDPRELRHFNLSVQITDEFMQAVRRNDDWTLVFPAESLDPAGTASSATVLRRWTGFETEVPCRVLKRLRARDLWRQIMRANYDYAEPGVLFVDRINEQNNLWYRERITATNPCGEIPLPPYGACNLGAINLTCFVVNPFRTDAQLDMEGIRTTAAIGTRMLDNVIDASRFPLAAQQAQAHGTRRIGLGLTGLGDTLIMLGVHYADQRARDLAAQIMREICHTAYRTSIELADQKGTFPYFDRDRYLQGKFIRNLPKDIQDGIAEHGIRNSHLTSIAPTGTVSMLANNVSSGVEPVYDFAHRRRVLQADGSYATYQLQDYAYHKWRELTGNEAALPAAFVAAGDLSPRAHLNMQAALQPYVDNAISKTINVPTELPFDEFSSIYEMAYDSGCKGCTTFRANPVTGSVLDSMAADAAVQGKHAPYCCSPEREAD